MNKQVLIALLGLLVWLGLPHRTQAQQPASAQAAQGFLKEDALPQPDAYQLAFARHKAMLEGSEPMRFKEAVFITENAFFDNRLDYRIFNQAIIRLCKQADSYIQNNSLSNYSHPDKDKIGRYGAIFKVMMDTLRLLKADGRIELQYPMRYDFDDIWGEKTWTKMFVTKLLITRAGNCHSLPYLYKIVAEEMKLPAYLAMAPNHTYIKLRSDKNGWYNTELTSASFPMDSWLMVSGYIPTEAIMSGIYMDTLSTRQSIATCVVDLAEGYKHRYGLGDGRFVLQCCELALNHYPNYINALLLKAETLKSQLETAMQKDEIKEPNQIKTKPDLQVQFLTMQAVYGQIHELGYRHMPKQMYLKWLQQLQAEKSKYTDNQVFNPLQSK